MATTQATKERQGEPTAPANEALLSEGQTTDLVVKDEYYVSPEERKAYGIGDNMALHWVRNPADWKETEKSDRIRQFQRDNPGAQIVRDGNEAVTNIDLVLMQYPKAIQERRESADVAKAEEWLGEIEEERHKDHFDRERLSRSDLREMRERNKAIHRSDGLIGPTKSLSLDEARRRYTPEQRAREEAKYRRGPNAAPFTGADWAETVERHGGTARNKATYGFGDTGFPRNPNSPVAQAAARKQGDPKPATRK